MNTTNFNVGDTVKVVNLKGTGVEDEARLIGMKGTIESISLDAPMPYYVAFKRERMVLSFYASNIKVINTNL